MANVTIANPMAINGQAETDADKLALALKVFSGETLTAFQRTSVTSGRVMERTIASGKSAQCVRSHEGSLSEGWSEP